MRSLAGSDPTPAPTLLLRTATALQPLSICPDCQEMLLCPIPPPPFSYCPPWPHLCSCLSARDWGVPILSAICRGREPSGRGNRPKPKGSTALFESDTLTVVIPDPKEIGPWPYRPIPHLSLFPLRVTRAYPLARYIRLADHRKQFQAARWRPGLASASGRFGTKEE